MKALNGMMPFEAATGQHPDLSQLQEWGCHVWVHDVTASKLELHAHEGCWIGFNEASTSSQVYWTETCHVSVEHNIIFSPASACQFEGEKEVDEDIPVGLQAPSPPILTPAPVPCQD